MDVLTNLLPRLEQLNQIGAALSDERNIDRLLENILLAAKAITHADGGSLYRVTEDRKSLHFEIVRTASLGLALGGASGDPIGGRFPDLPLYRENGEPNNSLVAAYSALSAETVNIADAYAEDGFDFSGTRRFDEMTGYRSRSFLTVPMKNHENEIIGVLQLINATDPEDGAVRVFSQADQRLAESLASQAAVALTNRLLVSQLEALFESFITLINLAIDEKSPYTGGHCQRVPSLTMMLAEAVVATCEGPLAGFAMSDGDRYELSRSPDCCMTAARSQRQCISSTRRPSCRPSSIASILSIRVSKCSGVTPSSPCCVPSWPAPTAKQQSCACSNSLAPSTATANSCAASTSASRP